MYTETEELRDYVVSLVLDNGWSVHETVDKILPEAELSEEVAYELTRMGLMALANRSLSDKRSEPPPSNGGQTRSGKRTQGPKRTERTDRFYWLAKQYQAADGSIRPLLDFKQEDFAHCEDWARGRAKVLEQRADFFGACRAELGSSEKALRDLSVTKLVKLDSYAKEVLEA